MKNKRLREKVLCSVLSPVTIEIHPSKKGPLTMRMNGNYLYSCYDPIKDVERFMDSQIEEEAESYCLFGFGLGYHVQYLLRKERHKRVIMIEPYASVIRKAAECMDLSFIFSHPNVEIFCLEQGSLPIELWNEIANGRTRTVISNAWLKALPQGDKLKSLLEDIKIRDMSFQRFSLLMEKNFKNNVKCADENVSRLFSKFNGQKAILVSAGPSLDDSVHSLKKLKGKYFMLSVGSALRVLKANGVVPDAVIITDPQEFVRKQLDNMEFVGPLIYLSTACHSAVFNHEGVKIIAFQKGYPQAECYAEKGDVSLVDTGGSVATTALDILIKMGFSEIVLVGQDLAYSKGKSHALQSTSGVSVVSDESLLSAIANDGTIVKTTTILAVYKRWFERKVSETKHVIFKNTAEKGAAIEGVPFVHISNIVSEAETDLQYDFVKKITEIVQTK